MTAGLVPGGRRDGTRGLAISRLVSGGGSSVGDVTLTAVGVFARVRERKRERERERERERASS